MKKLEMILKILMAVVMIISPYTISFALDSNALPTGGEVVSGQGSIVQLGNQMTIMQKTDKMIADWAAFNIGQDAVVSFIQPGTSSVALNHILDTNPSQIFGSLTANGQIFLINANGIIFSPTAQVDVHGLVASSLDLSNQDFLNDNYSFSNLASAGQILNQGAIKANDGYIAFLSPKITNEGVLSANSGNVSLLSGDKVTLDFSGDKLINYVIDQGTINGLVENKQLIRADAGAVIMSAKAKDELTAAVVNNSGVVEARTIHNKSGRIVLLSDMETGRTVSTGKLDVSAQNGGDAGFVETSGYWINVTEAPDLSKSAGRAGSWLIDPNNITIQAAGINTNIDESPDFSSTDDSSILTVATLKAALNAGGSVSVTTTSAGGNSQGGDIIISDAVTKDAGDEATLTLSAHRDITVNAAMSSSSNALNIVFDADSDRSSDGAIAINNDITTNGGYLKFGKDDTYVVGTIFAGAGTRSISTSGGAIDFYGDVVTTVDLSLDSSNGNITFNGKLDAGNSYALVGSEEEAGQYSWEEAKDDADSDLVSYLITITSSLENSLARSIANGKDVWTGGYGSFEGGTYKWRWKTGPECAMDGGGLHYFSGYNGATDQAVPDVYNNFGIDDEGLNGSGNAMQIWYHGGIAKWDDTTETTPKYYIRETPGTESDVAISSGSGIVTFSDVVGGIKALETLAVTSTHEAGIRINGGAVTTEGTQTYVGNVTLGSAATTLTQTNADTDFTVQANHSIKNVYGNDAGLTIKTTGSIIMDNGSSIQSPTGKLNTILWADAEEDTGDCGSGYIFIYDGNTINTNGGDIIMAGGTDDNADGIPDGYAVSTTDSASGVGIGRINNAASAPTTLQSGGGNILIRGKSTGASPSMGIHFAYSGTLDAGAGTLTMVSEASSYHGLEFSAWTQGMLNISAGTIDISGKTSSALYNGLETSELAGKYTTMTAGAGGIRLYGENTNSTTKGIEIAVNLTTTDGGNILLESPDGFNLYQTHTYNAGTGNITLRASSIFANNTTFTASGALTVEPYIPNTTISIGGESGTLRLPASYFSTNFTNGFSGITIGNASAGAITVEAAAALNDDTTFINNSTIAINGVITANEDLTLTSNGAISQASALSVTGTTTIAAGAANNITFTNTSNNFTGAVFVVSGNNVSIVDSNALTLGAVNAAGVIDIATLANDLTLSGAVVTDDTSSSAVTLNAGKSTTAGTSTGGNIVVSGGSIATGADGRAALYTGSISESSGVTSLIGSGSGKFRYNSDEAQTNYTAALGSGKYAIYREQPVVTLTADNYAKTYDGSAYSGGNGACFSGLVNADTSNSLGGTLTYTGTSQGAVDTGTYTIIPNYTNTLGYSMSFVNGTLTISKNTNVDTVASSLTSLQKAVNGSQQEPQVKWGLLVTPEIGPGAGSLSIEDFVSLNLIEADKI